MTDTTTANPVTVTKTNRARRPARSNLVDSKTVAAVDITTTNISVVVIDADGRPAAFRYNGHRVAPRSVHTVANSMQHIKTAVKAVTELITQGGTIRPATVVMVKGTWASMDTDPSAFRRAGIWWGIAAELDRLRIPTAEVPMMTVQKWAMGSAKPGRAGTDALTDWVAATWSWLPATYKDGFRPTTVAFAAAGAMAVGIETDVPVTQERLNLLRGYADENRKTRNNKAIQWSVRAKPAKTVAEFEMKKMAEA
ncbi:hypothetical protein ABQE48_13070 [Mycolicibacterium thermoresistibile]